MQLIYFDRDRAASKTTSSSSKLTHTLTYRGVSYELPKHRSIHSICAVTNIGRAIDALLTYRGMQYEIAPAIAPVTPSIQNVQRLIYRGTTYVVNAA